jgi:hypothetical protein
VTELAARGVVSTAMERKAMRAVSALLLSLACAALAPGAWADNGKGHGKGHGHGHGKGHGHGHGNAPEIAAAPARIVIGERDRSAVYSYYRSEFIGGRCPPGLARKGNGCLPPGQAKRLWTLGTPLAAAVPYYSLPAPLLARLSPAPAGYEYVRVDNDILLIATGTRVVGASLGSLAELQDSNVPLISAPDRDAMAAYYRNDYLAGNCPAGLRRTETGCQGRRLWTLGAPLEPSVDYELLPEPLLARLAPPPDGYLYIRVVDHVLLMELGSRLIRADILDLTQLRVTRIAVSPPVPQPLPPPAAVIVQERAEFGGGGCPPGLAKKNNGCLPPGHAK